MQSAEPGRVPAYSPQPPETPDSTPLHLIWGGTAIIDARRPAQADFGVVVQHNRIVSAGARAELARQFPQARQFGHDDYLLMPCFTNSHDHGRGLGSFQMGVPDDLLELWLPGLHSQLAVDPYLIAAYEGIQLLRSGVSLAAHSHNLQQWETMAHESEITLAGYKAAGVRVAFHPPLVDQNSLLYAGREAFLRELPADIAGAAQGFLGTPALSHDDYFAILDELYKNFHDPYDALIQIQASPAGGQWCSDELIVRAAEWAQANRTRSQMHMLETRYQRHYAWQQWDSSFIAHLDAIGALGPWLTLAHMIWIEPDDLDRLAQSGAAIAHNPSSNLRLRSGIAAIPELLAANVVAGVGMDGHTLDDDQDYLRELRLAWTLANRPGADAATVEPESILYLGLAGGAQATLGTGAPMGTLAPGNLADLILVDRRGIEGVWTSPRMSPAATLLRRGKREHIRHVMVNGEWKIRDGRSTQLNEEDIAAAIRTELQAYSPAAVAEKAAAADAVIPYLRRFYAAWDVAARSAEARRKQWPTQGTKPGWTLTRDDLRNWG